MNKDNKAHLDRMVSPVPKAPEDLMVNLDLLEHQESEEPTASLENKELQETVAKTVRKVHLDRGESLDHPDRRDSPDSLEKTDSVVTRERGDNPENLERMENQVCHLPDTA